MDLFLFCLTFARKNEMITQTTALLLVKMCPAPMGFKQKALI